MSMIDRYKKTGGFLQLLNLIETSGAAKQEKFLGLIKEEAPQWEEALRQKMLTINRIFGWSDVTLAEIVVRLQPLTIGTALHGLNPDQSEHLLKSLSFGQKRQIEEIKTSSKPGAPEISTAYIKIITEVREMVSHGILKFEKFDPDLVVDENIEEQLMKGGYKKSASATGGEGSADSPSSSGAADLVFDLDSHRAGSPASASGTSASDELEFLRRKVKNLTSELESLRKDNKLLQDKLAQIRRIA